MIYYLFCKLCLKVHNTNKIKVKIIDGFMQCLIEKTNHSLHQTAQGASMAQLVRALPQSNEQDHKCSDTFVYQVSEIFLSMV